MNKRVKHRKPEKERPKDDPRFQQLLAAARDGDENAIADLWREFGFRFGGGPAVIALEDIVQAALLAPPDRKKEALRVLRGEIPAADAAPSLPPLEPYLTLKEVAKRLGLDPSTLWRWQVPGHDLGGRRRFRLHEVVAYLESDLFKSRVSALRATRRTTKSTTP